MKARKRRSPISQSHHVCGVHELERAPISQAARVVSIIGPEDAESPLLGIQRPLLVLRFHDAIRPEEGVLLPSEDHIEALLAFDEGARLEDRLVVHCTAGVSRSTAALAILLTQRYPEKEEQVFSVLRKIRPTAWPNSRMIELGDHLLGCEGALNEALKRHLTIQAQLHPEMGRSWAG